MRKWMKGIVIAGVTLLFTAQRLQRWRLLSGMSKRSHTTAWPDTI